MSDETPRKRPLSEIGHLFLTDVRDRQTGGAPRPWRAPPGQQLPGGSLPPPQSPPPGPAGRRPRSLDLTPEELALAFDADELLDDDLPDEADDEDEAAVDDASEEISSDGSPAPGDAPARPVTAIIAAHLGGQQSERARQYARHLASRVGRVGLIELDSSEFRLACFDSAGPPDPPAASESPDCGYECHGPREMAEAIEEMNWDVCRWLLLLPNPRTIEAKALLREAGHWVLLSTPDHDGVVGSYRMLKGLAENPAGTPPDERPALSLAVLDGGDPAEVARVYEKLAGVCGQFLGWDVRAESPVAPLADLCSVVEHEVLRSKPNRDKAALATAPQWLIVADFLARSGRIAPAPDEDFRTSEAGRVDGARSPEAQPRVVEAGRAFCGSQGEAERSHSSTNVDSTGDAMTHTIAPPPVVASVVSTPGTFVSPGRDAAVSPGEQPFASSFQRSTPGSPQALQSPAQPPAVAGDAEVLDLPGADTSAEGILGAVLRHAGHGLAELPIRPPMCPDARLAVGRDRRIVLLAVACQGLAELRPIGQAYRWLMENRVLIGMAVPQFVIDPNELPRLRLLVDQADLSAEVLRPLLQTAHVTVESYRRIRWAGRTGLLLEAA